jgi:Leucine-rich repeat (LRR) protein
MKKLLLVLLALPFIGFGQQTYVPDNNFEAFLEQNGMGNGIPNDDYVTTANINTVAYLDVSYNNISDLTGIEAFTALTALRCIGNQLTSLNVSQNTALIGLSCEGNQLTSLNVSQNTALDSIHCYFNQLTSLDVSQNTALTRLSCEGNQLTSLDVRNGNNTIFQYFYAQDNPNLYCIDVDDATWSTANWTVANYNIDPQHYFSANCSGTTAIEEQTTNKELLKVTDLLGRETKATNQLLFYIYNDGTVEKKVVIE